MRVTALWHYPIKSTLGEAVPRLDLDERGAVGDRLYAIADAAGKLGSGKTTERFTRIDNLLALSAKIKTGTVQVVFPDGREINIGSDDLGDELSGFLGQPVTLKREQAIPHHDDSAVHLLLSSELDGLQTLLPDAVIDPRRFRANMLLQTPAGMTGGDLVDTVLALGSVRLQVTHKTERCRMVTLAQEDFGYDPRVLRTIVQEFDVDFGIYAKVLKPGSVQVGDAVDMAPGPRTDFRGNALGI
ncbi:MOSC domain-containing protein [Labrenzia sp. VG12]|uniref:MOSC domain-containing protein n=1 Tax=Labrenzia sp. VG12 TaxID=2021862 RepID=UPI0018DFA6E1|nr:MOSC domain-containing protein [Labrenzia sp. VG12]